MAEKLLLRAGLGSPEAMAKIEPEPEFAARVCAPEA
jgi:hypothetical protein